jgi:hypothetical protein
MTISFVRNKSFANFQPVIEFAHQLSDMLGLLVGEVI